jgi:hypothetical protein
MRYILLLLFLTSGTIYAQQKESSVSVSCYVNPELYIQAGVVAHVSDKSGNMSCSGQYITFNNKSRNTFYYKSNNRWVALAPQKRAVVLVPRPKDAPQSSISLLKLGVKYKPDAGSISSKLSAINDMNAQTEKVKARELSGETLKTADHKPAAEPASKAVKPSALQPGTSSTAKTPTKTTKTSTTRTTAVAKAKPQTRPRTSRPSAVPQRKPQTRTARMASRNNAVGLRVDFGTGPTGLGPNLKHKLNKTHALDAAIVFFQGDAVGLGVQVERNFPVRGTPGLDWYIGVGPQFLFSNQTNAFGIVPVGGLEYDIPGSPLNFSFDWRPALYLTPGTVEAGRFGVSLRVAF